MPKSYFDTFLSRVFEAAGISSQLELADLLGVNRSAVTQARRKNAVPDKWVLKLFRKLRLSPDWVLEGRGPIYVDRGDDKTAEFAHVPKVKARLCAGAGSFEVSGEIEDYYAFRKDWLSGKGVVDHMVLMDIVGNSMAPELKDGDTVLVDESQKAIYAGAIYAVGIDDTVLVKRLEKRPQKLVMLSDNPDYAPIFLEGGDADQVRIVGKVIWSARDFR